MGETLGNRIGLSEEVIKRAVSLAMEAHNYPAKLFLREKRPGFVVFAFAGSWVLGDWFGQPSSFGETKMDSSAFPSLRSLSENELALVNASFLRRFKDDILSKSSLAKKVKKVSAKKQVVFTGHSSGGVMAILATLYFLEKPEPNQNPPLCLTFGSPLVGDRIFGHAVRREQWSDHFIHFVRRYDVIPRIMLSPSSTEYQQILNSVNPRSQFHIPPIPPLDLYRTVMTGASSVANHDACNLMGCTNSLLQNLKNFIGLSPYRPFGTYIFCTGNGRLVVVRNPDAVLQILVYCAQWEREDEEVAKRSLVEHLAYKVELEESLGMQNVVYLDSLEEIPLSSDGGPATVNTALNDLGLSPQARLCLQAVGELEKRRSTNQVKIDKCKQKIEVELRKLREYKENAETCRLCYYDSFKLQEKVVDFQANVNRLVLAGIWDEIMEMFKAYELPDEFEKSKEFIQLGTEYRHIVEPLDIANFYRHSKDRETGAYVKKGTRPKRYRYTQSWLESAENKPPGSLSQSCFWAEVEDLIIETRKNDPPPPFEDTKQKVQRLAKNLLDWIDDGSLGRDALFENSTFVQWWKGLPPGYKSGPESSSIEKRIAG